MDIHCFKVLLAFFSGVFLRGLNIQLFSGEDRSWFRIGEVFSPIIVTLGLAYFAYKNFWPDFKKQKRIENLINNAKKGLEEVSNAETIITKLYPLLGKNDREAEYKKIQSELLMALRLLRDILLLLSKSEYLIEHKQIISFHKFIANLEKVLLHKYENLPDSYLSIDFLSEAGLIDEKNRILSPLEPLRQELLKIYEMQGIKNDNS